MESEKTVSQLLGETYQRLTYSDISAQHRTKLHELVVDVIGCAFAGLDDRKAIAAREIAANPGGNSEATVVGTGDKLPVSQAAFANAVAAHSLTYDDRHRASSTHPGSIVVPTALAVGESVGASGTDVLTATLAGYEVVGHLGSLRLGFNTDLPRRPTPVFGPFGSALTAGLLYDLTPQEIATAVGYAANMSGGLSQVWVAGTDEYVFHNALAARQGITAARLADRGLLAAPRSLEGEYGFFRAFYGEVPGELSAVPDRIREADEIDDVFGKPIPACGMVVVPVQLADELRNLMAERDYVVDSIDSIEITVSARTRNIPGCSHMGPFDTPTRALMSIPFGVASTLVRGGYTWTAPAEHHDDEGIQTLVDRIELSYDSSQSKYHTSLEVAFTDGTISRFEQGEPEQLEADAIDEKFRRHAAEWVDADAALAELYALADNDDVGSVGPLLGE